MSSNSPDLSSNLFYWFPNHGDDDGNKSFTICYGNPDDDLECIIVGAEDSEDDAIEACKRLNGIMSSLPELPPLCPSCEGWRSQVDLLREALKSVRIIVKESGTNWDAMNRIDTALTKTEKK